MTETKKAVVETIVGVIIIAVALWTLIAGGFFLAGIFPHLFWVWAPAAIVGGFTLIHAYILAAVRTAVHQAIFEWNVALIAQQQKAFEKAQAEAAKVASSAVLN